VSSAAVILLENDCPLGPCADHTGGAVLDRAAPMGSPPSALGDPAELFDIDMHQLARQRLLIPRRLGTADWETGGLVDVLQQRHPEPSEHPSDRRSVQMQVVRNSVRTPPAGETQRDDPALGPHG
jgi:hypothetical protein